MENKLLVSNTPHIRSEVTTKSLMTDVIIALTPAALMGVYYFGYRALALIIVSIAFSVIFEWAFQKITKKPITISDMSAVVTGLLLAMNLPASAPIWMAIVGAFVAIVLAKQIFGGIGQNFINPALAARAFLLASYPTEMTKWTEPSGLMSNAVDAVTTATPLAQVKSGEAVITMSNIIDAFIGNVGGCLGETCALALIAGGIYLLVKKVISWRIPVTYIVTVFVLTFLFGRMPIYEMFIGGLMLGAFFMATDYTTSPLTAKGQIIMGIGCGLLTALIRVFGGYPEGVSYSILIMNLFVPLIDRYTLPKTFGEVKK